MTSRRSNLPDQLKRYLGRAGAEMFALLVSLAPISNSNLLRWTLALDDWQRQRNPGKPRRAYNEALVGQWRQAINKLPAKLRHAGLEFHVNHLEVWGRSGGRKWRGLLLLIYEYRTNTLFHHVTDLKPTEAPKPALLWFAIDKACRQIAESDALPELIQAPKSIYLPGEADLAAAPEAMKRFYADTESEWSSTQDKETGNLWCDWRGREVKIVAREWSVDRLSKPLWPSIRVRTSSSNEFRRHLTALATQLTKQLGKQPSSPNRITPSWLPLNTARTKRASE